MTHDKGCNKQGLWVVVLATLLCLLPFITKAFHVDDTLFLWTARHIQAQPYDFYGFPANWYGTTMSMAEINQNPPFAAYYIALVTLLFGWQEWPLHLAFMLPAVGVVAGTYVLAGHFTSRPRLSALIALATPVFLVSATNVMSDVLMLSFFLWALVFWVKGLERQRFSWLLAASLLVALAALTKYFALTAIALLFVYTVVQPGGFHRNKRTLLLLLLPLLVMFGYETLTQALYGRPMFTSAISYSVQRAASGWNHILDQGLTGLSFMGGCVASTLLISPLLWVRRTLLIGGLALIVIVGGTLLMKGSLGGLILFADGKVSWLPVLQLVLFVVGGIHLLILACVDLYQHRNAASLMLFCWLVGTFVFATFLNWTINGRTMLPMVPAAALLISRRLDLCATTGRSLQGVWLAVGLALLLALCVTWGDFAFANAQRHAAAVICAEQKSPARTLWFQGHWGFQYYMEQAGAKAVDFANSGIQPEDYLVVPGNNTNVYRPDRAFQDLKSYRFPAGRVVGTLNGPPVGAGFYASIWGPLPYVFGRIPHEEFKLYRKVY